MIKKGVMEGNIATLRKGRTNDIYLRGLNIQTMSIVLDWSRGVVMSGEYCCVVSHVRGGRGVSLHCSNL